MCSECPANQHPKSTIKKKDPHAFAHLVNFSPPQICPPCLIIIQSCYCDYRTNKPFTWSRCTTRPKDHRLFLNYPQINEVGKSDQMAANKNNSSNMFGHIFSRFANFDLLVPFYCHVFNWSSLAQTHRQWTVPGRRTRDLPWQRTSVLSKISCQDWPADTFWCRWGPGEETFVIWSPETLNWKVTNKKAPKHRFRLYSGKETLGRVCLGLQWMVWVY